MNGRLYRIRKEKPAGSWEHWLRIVFNRSFPLLFHPAPVNSAHCYSIMFTIEPLQESKLVHTGLAAKKGGGSTLVGGWRNSQHYWTRAYPCSRSFPLKGEPAPCRSFVSTTVTMENGRMLLCME